MLRNRAIGRTLRSAATDFPSFVRSNNLKKEFYSVVFVDLSFTCRNPSGYGSGIRPVGKLASCGISALSGESPMLTGKN
jgi:hypothetical protein